MTRAALVLLLALALAGCGLGAGDSASSVHVTVTRDFGARRLGAVERAQTRGEETVMRLLQRSFDVKTRYGGGFVQSIDGLAGGRSDGRPVDWFFYVNGIESEQGAAAVKLRSGDRVLWDRHDWGVTQRVPAIVGAFPEPFLSGHGGKRYPTRLDCAPDAKAQCDTVGDRLQAAGVTRLARAGLRQSAGVQLLRIVVGRWDQVRTDPVVERVQHGPQTSGVYVRFASDARTLDVLDARGRVARRLGAGAGLVAATRFEEQQPTWVVTGTDDRGVAAAAAALDEGVLDAKFALAIDAQGRGVGVPVP